MTAADGSPGQWYLHLYDPGQPDWDWRHPDVPALFEDVIRFWLDRGVAGLRVDVAHGLFKDPDLPDLAGAPVLHAPSPYRHRPELQELYRSWRAILDSYPADGFPGSRTAIGEVWYDRPETLMPYLAPGGLPQVFNFQLILPGFAAAGFRDAIDSALSLTSGSRAPWVIGNHDVPRPASRYRLDEGYSPEAVRPAHLPRRPERRGRRPARAGGRAAAARPARIGLHLPGRGTRPARGHRHPGRRAPGSQVPPHRRPGSRTRRLPRAHPLDPHRYGLRFLPNGPRCVPAEPWLPQPPDWGRYSVESQLADERSFLSLYRTALRLRRDHSALGSGTLRWLDAEGLLCFAREPGFIFAANLGAAPAPLPAHREILLASAPVTGGSLPPDTAAWLSS